MYRDILYEVADPVATITLNRPDRLNAWTGRMTDEIRHAVAQAEEDTSVVGICVDGSRAWILRRRRHGGAEEPFRGGQRLGRGAKI